MDTKKTLVLALIAISGLGLISCGPQKIAGSNTQNTLSNVSQQPDTKAIASCSADVGGLNDLGVKLQTYSLSGISNSNWVRVKFTKFPTSFDLQSQIAFWAYSTDTSGVNSTPLQAQFYVEYINSSNQAVRLSNDMGSVTWSSLKNMAVQAGIATTNAQVALSSMIFVVKLENSLMSSQVLMPTLYQSAAGSPDRYLSALIPQFYASPSDYAASGKHSSLQMLHPLKAQAGSTMTTTQWQSLSQQNCIL